MKVLVVLAGMSALFACYADTLVLRSGKTVQGSYLGGTARQIRMAVEDRVETYAVSDIQSLQFEAAQPAAAIAPTPAPATAVAASSGNELASGTAITIRMIDDVDSQVANPGQTFRASIDDPVVVDGKTIFARGADATLRLTEVKEAGKISGAGQLTLV